MVKKWETAFLASKTNRGQKIIIFNVEIKQLTGKPDEIMNYTIKISLLSIYQMAKNIDIQWCCF